MQIKNSSEKFGNLREIYPRCVDVERRTGSLRIVENIFVRVTVRPATVGELAFPRRFLGPPECLVWRDENCAIAISWREWNYTVPLWGVVIRSKHDCPTNRHFAVTLYPCVKRRRLLSTSFANSKLGRSQDHNSNRFPSKREKNESLIGWRFIILLLILNFLYLNDPYWIQKEIMESSENQDRLIFQFSIEWS